MVYKNVAEAGKVEAVSMERKSNEDFQMWYSFSMVGV